MAFTTNVNGHFQRADFEASRVTECHGSIHHLQCLDGCTDEIWPVDGFHPVVEEENCLLLNDLPLCPHCGGLARPNIYMFGAEEWLEGRALAQRRRLEHWLRSAERLLIIEIGAGTAISATRDLTHRIAFDFHAPVIRINPRDPAIYGNPSHVSLAMEGMQALQKIDTLLIA